MRSRKLSPAANSWRGTLIDQALDRITDPSGEGSRAFVSINQSARAQADEIDRRRANGEALPPFAGIPLALKDLFDVAGEITSAGSRLFAHEAPALRDAPTVARLRAAGFVFVGRNNMTRVCVLGPRPESALRHAGQSVRSHDPQAHSRWLHLRRRRRSRGRNGCSLPRHRYGQVRAAFLPRSVESSASNRPHIVCLATARRRWLIRWTRLAHSRTVWSAARRSMRSCGALRRDRLQTFRSKMFACSCQRRWSSMAWTSTSQRRSNAASTR